MPRIIRSQLDDGLFHVTARGNRGSMIFVDDLDRVDFLHLLQTTTEGFGWRRLAHCLMGTHYHVVFESSRANLSDGMQRLNGMYARRFNRRHGFRATSSRIASPRGSCVTSSTSTPRSPTFATTLCGRGCANDPKTGRGAPSPGQLEPAPTRPPAKRPRRARSRRGTQARARPASSCVPASCPRR
jgi:REP element-mobilizing transposase RayT